MPNVGRTRESILTARAKKWLAALVRYSICAAALGWLYYTIDWAQLRQVVADADWRVAAIALLTFGPVPVLIAIRLKWLLAVQKIHLTVWQAVKVTFAGNFIITALPVGTSGGDSVKAYYVARDTPHKHEAVTTVFFDRMIGVLSLFLMSGVMVLANWQNPAFRFWGRVIGLALLALMIGACIYFSRRIRRVLRFDQLLALLPLADHVQRIDRAVLLFRHHLGRLAACLALTVLLQMVSIFAYFLGGLALGLVGDQPWSALPVYLAYTPICFLTGALPIGVTEVTFAELFADAAQLGTREAALSVSFFGRIMQLTWALPGALVVLKSRPRPLEQPLPQEDASTPAP